MQRGTGTLRFVCLGALAAGCTASGGDESILVLKNVAPPMGATGGVCPFTAMETEAGIVHGVLDTTAGTGYQFTAQLKSRVTAAAGQADLRTIVLRGANVDLKFTDASVLSAVLADPQAKNLLHSMVPFSAPLPPGGVADASFELVPPQVAAAVRDALAAESGVTSTVVQATFTVVGDLAGGNVSSQTFQYSVTLGNQILLVDQGNCSTVLRSFMPRTGNPCYFGQDFVVDCCTDTTTNPNGRRTCPAVGTKM